MSEQRLERRLHVPGLPAYRLVVALWGGLALLDALRILGAAPAVELAAMAGLVAGCSVRVHRAVAVSVAGIGWLLVNGFVVHGLGQLGYDGVPDLLRAALLLGAALLAAEVGR